MHIIPMKYYIQLTAYAMTVLLQWICLAAVICSVDHVMGTSADNTETACPRGEAETYRHVIPCLHKGERFLRRYFRRYHRQSYVMCNEYSEFQECTQDLLSSCPDVAAHLPREWLTTIELLNCACAEHDVRHTECTDAMTCMIEELNGDFCAGCDRKYERDVQQNTNSDCHFLHDYIHCKVSLISSACGDSVGNLFFIINKVAAWESHQCDVRRIPDYAGFTYSEDCPRNIGTKLDNCVESSLTSVLEFYPDNDLIATGDRGAVEQACSAYTAYKPCLERWRSRCPKGVHLILEKNYQLRTYLLKMQYICDTSQGAYAASVDCYQLVQQDAALASCSSIWTTIERRLNRTSAFQYFCQSESAQTIKIKQGLHRLALCYKDTIATRCTQAAGSAMQGLTSRALNDSLYLSIPYTPDCALHTMTSYEQSLAPPPPPQAAAVTKRPRHTGAQNKDKTRVTASGVQSGAMGTQTYGSLSLSCTLTLVLLQVFCLVT